MSTGDYIHKECTLFTIITVLVYWFVQYIPYSLRLEREKSRFFVCVLSWKS